MDETDDLIKVNSSAEAIDLIKKDISSMSIEMNFNGQLTVNFYCYSSWFQLSKVWNYRLEQVELVKANGVMEVSTMKHAEYHDYNRIEELFFLMEDWFKKPLDEITFGMWHHIER